MVKLTDKEMLKDYIHIKRYRGINLGWTNEKLVLVIPKDIFLKVISDRRDSNSYRLFKRGFMVDRKENRKWVLGKPIKKFKDKREYEEWLMLRDYVNSR